MDKKLSVKKKKKKKKEKLPLKPYPDVAAFNLER